MQLSHSGLFGFTNRYKPEANQKYPQIAASVLYQRPAINKIKYTAKKNVKLA